MNSPYRRRYGSQHKKLKVHKFACVHLKPKPNQLSKCALYHKMMQLSTKHLSETNNYFENCYLKSIIFEIKIKLFTIFQSRLTYFVIKIILVLNILPILGLVYF